MPAVSKTVMLPCGDKVTLFYIGALAYALGRTVPTVRKWEISGALPDSCFKDKSTGRRMYTQEQIDIIVKIAEKTGISQGRAIANTSFSKQCFKELSDIRNRYMKKAE